MRMIDETAMYISPAAERNYQRWPVIDIQIDRVVGTQPKNHTQAITHIKKWLRQRARCLDKYFEQPPEAIAGGNSLGLNEACRGI